MQAHCCTKILSPGEDIQAAIDSMPDTGGCICLKAGKHEITEAITITQSNITLHGECQSTVVERSNGMNLLNIGSVITGVVVDGIEFVAKEKIGNDPAIIIMSGSHHTSIVGCSARLDVNQESTGDELIGIMVHFCHNPQIIGNRIEGVSKGIYATLDFSKIHSWDQGISIMNNILANPLYSDQKTWGIHIEDDIMQPCRISGNSISEYLYGITVNKLAFNSIIEGNEILRGALVDVLPDGPKHFGIEVTAPHCVIGGNRLNLTKSTYGGIWVTGTYAIIEKNFLHSSVSDPDPDYTLPIGIYLCRPEASSEALPDHGVIRGNLLTGLQNAIHVSGSEICVEEVQVLGNHIKGGLLAGASGNFASDEYFSSIGLHCVKRAVVAANQITVSDLGIYLYNGKESLITQNTLSEVIEDSIPGGIGGITIIDSEHIAVTDNQIGNMKNHGILLMSTDLVDWSPYVDFMLHGNRVLDCGYEASSDILAGVCHGGVVGIRIRDISIESCKVTTTGPEDTLGINLTYIKGDTRICGNRVTGSADAVHTDKEHKPLILESEVEIEDQAAGAQIVDNVFIGYGTYLVSVDLEKSGDIPKVIVFSNNRCELTTISIALPPATVKLVATDGYLSAMGNHVRADQSSYDSFDLQASYIVASGNITSGSWPGIFAPGQLLPAPKENYNHIGV